jgi:nucleoside-diphosphate-sugar epimerase
MENGKQTIFITGGAGFLGINLVRFLLDKNYTVVSFDIAEFDYPEKDRVKSIKGDIRDMNLLKESMTGSDMVIHCAAALPLYSKEDIFSIDVDGTRNVLEAANLSNIPRVVHISSTAVYGIKIQGMMKEDDPCEVIGPYAEAKVLSENECKKFREKGMCIPILRPKTIIGPERLGIFAILYDWAKEGRNFPIIGKGNNKYQLLDVRDFCEAIYSSMTKEKEIVNSTFNIASKEFFAIKDNFQAVLDYAGFGKKIIAFPAKPAILALKFLEKIKLSPVYKWVYETAGTDSYVSIQRAEELLGYQPQYSDKDALIANYKWYLENLNKIEKTTGISHRVPWKQGILKLIKKFF